MTKLSREYQGKPQREGWEIVFATWWGLSIKFFVPFALWFLICLSLKADLDSPYGGYHGFWQIMGWLFPLVGFVMFIVPVFFPPSPEKFKEDQLKIFDEDWNPPLKKEKKRLGRMPSDVTGGVDAEKAAALKEAELGIVVDGKEGGAQ